MIFGRASLLPSIFATTSLISETLLTPKPILQTTDVPERSQRKIAANVSYPANPRYRLQWIVTPMSEFDLAQTPNHNDTTFMNQTLPKPADVLLHYNYGAAVVKHWGPNTGVLAERPDLPRPAALPIYPRKSNHDVSAGATADPGMWSNWDEHDVMFIFGATRRRYRKGMPRRSRSVQRLWRFGWLKSLENQPLDRLATERK